VAAGDPFGVLVLAVVDEEEWNLVIERPIDRYGL